MASARERSYRTEDPTRPDVAELQGKFREALDSIALDEETDFFDKLYTLEATQRGNFREFRSNKLIENLDRASKGLVLLTASSMLIVGHLDPENPWTFRNISETDDATKIDLAARFKQAYAIGDTLHWEHESFGQSSRRSETGPSLNKIEDNELVIGLPEQPIGSENLYTKVETFSKNVFFGEFAIHHRIVSLQQNNTVTAQAALHSAVTVAVSKMS